MSRPVPERGVVFSCMDRSRMSPLWVYGLIIDENMD
jgi:hypothetical protein